MNDFRMMIFIEEYIGDALKKGRSEKFCIKKLNDYNKQVRECKASSLFNKEWLNDSFGMEVLSANGYLGEAPWLNDSFGMEV